MIRTNDLTVSQLVKINYTHQEEFLGSYSLVIGRGTSQTGTRRTDNFFWPQAIVQHVQQLLTPVIVSSDI